MTETDGINDTFERGLRTALMAAAQAGEQLARLREHQRRQAEARSRTEAAQLQARLHAQQTAAHSRYAATSDPGWWDRTTVDDVVATYQTAAAWRDADPRAEAAMRHIEREAKTRHNIDLTPTTTAAQQHTERSRREAREAAALLAAANAADRDHAAAQAEGDPQRAEQARDTAAGLHRDSRDARADADRSYSEGQQQNAAAATTASEAKAHADLSQAKPATHATHQHPGRAPRGRPARRSPNKQRARGR